MKTSKPSTSYLYLIVLLIVGSLAACDFYSDGGGEKEKAYQTRIIDVLVVPADTAAPGDTLTFICIIEDSLDTRFDFYWSIKYGMALDAEFIDNQPVPVFLTNENMIKWIAPNEDGFKSFTVRANNYSNDSIVAEKSFTLIV